ncbi:MAG: hypothetical protein UH824_00310 [Acutalibacteraceae bacterium]|nr:hypothetical protein [Acutalibacteraceae bacterium]
MFILELIIDAIVDCWFDLMEWIVPEKSIGIKAQIILNMIVFIFTLLLFITLIFGIFAIFSDDPYIRLIGKYMVFIPLCISAVQIILGIIVRVIENKKK